ncbi:hypothetical protein DAEQUDRAFT_92878 [Daedalea quercina L-15889]|uniref:Uncharacterized protein n=1 Tax=Daedalea quercina L-15889 TaxID=1314783 RepID=A0A165S933_9APHY|nr:hypothetical protein DAEQUDRAFT_92878 [Daedalea quercina L-15889]
MASLFATYDSFPSILEGDIPEILLAPRLSTVQLEDDDRCAGCLTNLQSTDHNTEENEPITDYASENHLNALGLFEWPVDDILSDEVDVENEKTVNAWPTTKGSGTRELECILPGLRAFSHEVLSGCGSNGSAYEQPEM